MRNSILLEGTKYDEKAIKKLVDSGLFDKETSTKIVNGLFKEDIHAFVHCPSWLEKYLIGIVNMLIKYANGSKERAVSFLNECPSVFDSYLTYVKEERPRLDNDKDRLAFDNKFNQEMSYEDVVRELEEIMSKLDAKSKDELSKLKFDESSNYELVPIDSFEKFHSMFGGHWTGDGSSDRYAGGGGTAWCHANSESTYNSWVNNGKNKFFVLANKNWKNIKFNRVSNQENPKDEYGNSLIALLVNKKNNSLKNATLRCNHVGVPSNADTQYKTYSELSSLAGFNVEEKINELNHVEVVSTSGYDYSIFDGSCESLDDFLAEYEIERRDLETFVISNSVTSIGSDAFDGCSSLTSITIPNSVTSIRSYAFYGCSSLTSITIPDSVTIIGSDAFCNCRELTSITIPNSVTSIGSGAFDGCSSLTSITIPNSVTSIGYRAFDGCSNLTSITIPDSVTGIGSGAFYGCRGLIVHTNNDYVANYCKRSGIPLTSSSNESLKESIKQSSVKSNGVYSVMKDKWIKEPVVEDIPVVDKDEFEKLYNIWEDKYFQVVESNDVEYITDFIEDIYDLRKESIANEGEYGLGNLVFKEIRNLGYLDNLKDLKNEIKGNELSLSNERGTTTKDYAIDDTKVYDVNESSISRIRQHLIDDKTCAIISTYTDDRSEEENYRLLKKLKSEVKMKYGFIEFVSRWSETTSDGVVSSDERALMIPNISYKDAMKISSDYGQKSFIFKDEESCEEICSKPFIDYNGVPHEVGDVVRTFNTEADNRGMLNLKDAEEIFAKRKGGPASHLVKGDHRSFHLKEVLEVVEPRASYFDKGRYYLNILK